MGMDAFVTADLPLRVLTATDEEGYPASHSQEFRTPCVVNLAVFLLLADLARLA